MARVVVTGAAGFLGRYVSRAAAARGDEVIGIGHGQLEEDDRNEIGLSQWHELDVTLASLIAHADRPDVIVHCAGSGSVGFSIENPAQDFDRTVSTTRDILEYIRTSSTHTRLVYPSSAAVYGVSDRIPLNVASPLKPVSPYGVHKKIAEDLVTSYGASFRVHSAVVRVFSAYGRELRKQLLWDACQKVSHGSSEFGGTGQETRDWVHAEDIASLLMIASIHASPDVPIVNGSTGWEVSTSEILNELFTTLGAESRPSFSGRSRPGDPGRLAGDPTDAQAWGWAPRWQWRDGIQDYARWYVEERV